MPNLRAQIVGPLGDKAPSAHPGDQVGIWMQASDGREFVITRRMLRQRFVDETGGAAVRKARVRQWLRERIRDSLGEEQVDPARVEWDFDEEDGSPTGLEVS